MKQHYRKPALQGFFQRINLAMLAMQIFPMPDESVLWGKMEGSWPIHVFISWAMCLYHNDPLPSGTAITKFVLIFVLGFYWTSWLKYASVFGQWPFYNLIISLHVKAILEFNIKITWSPLKNWHDYSCHYLNYVTSHISHLCTVCQEALMQI